jgi:probable F420-dependent oxidoreductase
MTNIGCFIPSYAGSGPIDTPSIMAFSREAERLGYSHLWAGDHYLWNVGILSPMTTLAAVSSVTETIRLGTGVYLMNLRHPSITAKDIASVDVLSGGRLIMGIGIGGDNPEEYRVMGVEPNARGKRLEENMAAVQSLLEQNGTEFAGEYVTVSSFTMAPAPIQKPVPIWIGGRAQVVVERSARSAQGWFPVWVSPSRIKAAWETVDEIRGSREGFHIALNIFATIDDTREAAGKAMATHLNNAYGLPFDAFERYSAYGSADDLVETLNSYIDAGATDIALNIAGPQIGEQLQRFAEEVIPRLS